MLTKVIGHLFFNVVEVFASLAFVSLNIFCILTNHGHSTNLCPIEPHMWWGNHISFKFFWVVTSLTLVFTTSLMRQVFWLCDLYAYNMCKMCWLTSFVNVVIMVNYFGIINWKYPTTLGMPFSYVIIASLCCYKVAISTRVVTILRYNCNLDLNIIIKKLLVVFFLDYWAISSNVQVGAQMGGPICHRSKVLIYSKSWSNFGNYNWFTLISSIFFPCH
jgi:hypothetical protein